MRRIPKEISKHLFKEIKVNDLSIAIYFFADYEDYFYDVTFQSRDGNNCELVVHKEYFNEIFASEIDYQYLEKVFEPKSRWYSLISPILFYLGYILLIYKSPLYVLYHFDLPDSYYFQVAKLVLGWLYILAPVIVHLLYLIRDIKNPPLTERAIFYKIDDIDIRRGLEQVDKNEGMSLIESKDTAERFKRNVNYKYKLPMIVIMFVALMIVFTSFKEDNGFIKAIEVDNVPSYNSYSYQNEVDYAVIQPNFILQSYTQDYSLELRNSHVCGEYICNRIEEELQVYDIDMNLVKSYTVRDTNVLNIVTDDYISKKERVRINDEDMFELKVIDYDGNIHITELFEREFYVINIIENYGDIYVFLRYRNSDDSHILKVDNNGTELIELDFYMYGVVYDDEDGFVIQGMSKYDTEGFYKYNYRSKSFSKSMFLEDRGRFYYHDNHIYKLAQANDWYYESITMYDENFVEVKTVKIPLQENDISFRNGYFMIGSNLNSLVVYDRDLNLMSHGLDLNNETTYHSFNFYFSSSLINENKFTYVTNNEIFLFGHIDDVEKTFLERDATTLFDQEFITRFAILSSIYLPCIYVFMLDKKNPSY